MKLTALSLFLLVVFADLCSQAQTPPNGLSGLYLFSDAKSRSISPENLSGEKGEGGKTPLEKGSAAYAARELGQGWKVNPYRTIKGGETFTMAEMRGPGIVNHFWITPTGDYRLAILRIYWDEEKTPSVEVPVGDFFCSGWGWEREPQINSLAVCVNPKNGFNCYWQMPFRKKCRITMENLAAGDLIIYYQVDFSVTDVPESAGYFHVQFRRVNPLPYKEDYTIVDGITGKGQYVGTYIAHGANSPGWWGEGEVKFFLDGDRDFPTICGTGEEDYFNGSYGYRETPDARGQMQYTDFSSPFSGFYHVPDSTGRISQRRFGEYRWHIMDPVRFEKELRVTIQCLGWQSEGRYLPLRDDMASVAYWYQSEPHNTFPPLPPKDRLVVLWADTVQHRARGCRVSLLNPPSPKYASNPALLTDGIQGSHLFNDNCWIGFEGTDMEATIDLGASVPVQRIKAQFLEDQGSWIFPPVAVDFLISDDGKSFRSVAKQQETIVPRGSKRVAVHAAMIEQRSARYVKVKAVNIGKCPDWHAGAGAKAWLFVDEIIVE